MMDNAAEIRLLAEKIMGWHQESWTDGADGGRNWVDKHGKYAAKCYYLYYDPIKMYNKEQDKVVEYGGGTIKNDVRHGWNPFKRIDHAFALYDKLRKRCVMIDLSWHECTGHECHLHPRYGCEIFSSGISDDGMGCHTIAIAICKAALEMIDNV